jgi:hypothetical protein
MADEKPIQDILAMLTKTPEVAGLAVSIGAIALGASLMIDDYRDFGKLGTERNPPVPHHEIYGILVFMGGVTGACASGLALLKKLPPPPKPVEKLPPSVLEGAPPEIVEQFR